MVKLYKILEPDFTPEEVDKILAEAISAKFDADLRADWGEKLKRQYSLSEDPKIIPIGQRRQSRLHIMGIAAGFILMIFSLFLLRPSSSNMEGVASSYLEQVVVYHPGSMKGAGDNQKNWSRAVEAFNNNNYADAAKYFSMIENPTEEDLFYSGVASLLTKNPQEAIAKFETIRGKDSIYQEATNWYLSIAFLLEGQQKKAKVLLSKIQPSEWNYNQAQELMKKIN